MNYPISDEKQGDYVSFTSRLTPAEKELEQARLRTLRMPASSEPANPRTTGFMPRPTRLRVG